MDDTFLMDDNFEDPVVFYLQFQVVVPIHADLFATFNFYNMVFPVLSQYQNLENSKDKRNKSD